MSGILLDIGCTLFFLATGMFCVNYGNRLRRKLDWCRYRWMAFVVVASTFIVGAWHLCLGALSLFLLFYGVPVE